MKKILITPLLLLLLVTSFSQDLNFDVRGKYRHPVNKEVLNSARSMGDIIPYYPAGWITGYVSVDISAITDDRTLTASGINDILTEEQADLLHSATLGTDIEINIQYLSENSTTGKLENRKMNYTATLVPETQAEFPDGYFQLRQYLQENAIDKISAEDSEQFEQAVVSFTVDEEGGIANARISTTSGDQLIDGMLINAVNNMPKWKPAEDSEGVRVKQEFEFSVQNANIGC
ncbi:MAG: energy transducer TonB [Bacteroidales bacterium]|jgi:TonB family protein|nr:energy transducer TonB [Bacteroidales bacterium]